MLARWVARSTTTPKRCSPVLWAFTDSVLHVLDAVRLARTRGSGPNSLLAQKATAWSLEAFPLRGQQTAVTEPRSRQLMLAASVKALQAGHCRAVALKAILHDAELMFAFCAGECDAADGYRGETQARNFFERDTVKALVCAQNDGFPLRFYFCTAPLATEPELCQAIFRSLLLFRPELYTLRAHVRGACWHCQPRKRILQSSFMRQYFS